MKDGHITINYVSGKKQIEYDVVNGKVNGEVIKYRRNGKLWQIRDIVNNKYHGYVKVYDRKGRLRFLQTTRNDTLIAEVDSGYRFFRKHLYAKWEWYMEKDTNYNKLSMKNRIYFNEFWSAYGFVPAINGITTIYYRSGQVKKIKTKVNRRRNGELVWFFKNGKIRKKIIYHMGKRLEKIK